MGSPIVSDKARNAQLDVRAGIELVPDLQMSAHNFCPLSHSRQPEVSGVLTLHDLLVNALSVIKDTQTELQFVVSDLHCDPSRLRVAKGIAQRFAPDAVGLVPHERVQAARHAFYFEIRLQSYPSLVLRQWPIFRWQDHWFRTPTSATPAPRHDLR